MYLPSQVRIVVCLSLPRRRAVDMATLYAPAPGIFMMTDSTQLVFDRISYDRFLADLETVAGKIEADQWRPDFIVGIGRGGLVPGAFLSHRTGIPLLSVDHSSKVYGFADELLLKLAASSIAGQRFLFIDDINDSGGTIKYLRETVLSNGAVPGSVRFAVLINNMSSQATVEYWSRSIDRSVDKEWFVFPWESVAPAQTLSQEAFEVPDRLGLSAGAIE
jgi:hypoxanthine phosphoribosyltransferase